MEDDQYHKEAIDFYGELRKGHHGAPASSDYILDETITLLRMRKGTRHAFDFVDEVFRSKTLHLVWLDPAQFQEAVKLLGESEERRWSFTDCTSFTIMRQLGIKNAFTFDKNYEEAGFTKLP